MQGGLEVSVGWLFYGPFRAFLGAILSAFGLFGFKRINDGQRLIYSERMMQLFRIKPRATGFQCGGNDQTIIMRKSIADR